MSCDLCGNAGHQCPFEPVPFDDLLAREVEKAVREEREAVVRFLKEEPAFYVAAFEIARGDHRK